MDVISLVSRVGLRMGFLSTLAKAGSAGATPGAILHPQPTYSGTNPYAKRLSEEWFTISSGIPKLQYYFPPSAHTRLIMEYDEFSAMNTTIQVAAEGSRKDLERDSSKSVISSLNAKLVFLASAKIASSASSIDPPEAGSKPPSRCSTDAGSVRTAPAFGGLFDPSYSKP